MPPINFNINRISQNKSLRIKMESQSQEKYLKYLQNLRDKTKIINKKIIRVLIIKTSTNLTI